MSRKIRLLVLPFCVLLLSPVARADQSDDALMKACPGVAAWAVNHPRHHEEPISASEATRVVDAPKLRDELARRASSDQSVRNAWTAASQEHKRVAESAVIAVDTDNLSWLKDLVERQGFPTVQQVGMDGLNHAWLLVQHADSDPAFQTNVLGLLKPRLASGDVRKQDFAMLTDRVRHAQGKPQIYGSQFKADQQGHLVLESTQDMAHLDDRRATMNLMPMAAYSCLLRFYNPSAAQAGH